MYKITDNTKTNHQTNHNPHCKPYIQKTPIATTQTAQGKGKSK